jgi:FemAB-related protein (PEP-CTERM system-associated)
MKIRVFRTGDARRWDDFVKRMPEATAYHQSGWRAVIEKSFGHQTCYWLAEARGEIAGILPAVQMKSRLFGHFFASLPFFNYGGVCSADGDARRGLIETAIRTATDAGGRFLELRHTSPAKFHVPLKVKQNKVSMRIDLPSSPDDLWKGFPSKLRSQIRRPEKDGMTGRVGGEEELQAFYRVFSTNMRDLGTPVYSKGFFRNILAAFPGSTWIATVYRSGEPVASGFLIGFRDTLEIPWASSLRRYNAMSANMLLYWTVLKFACESGFRTFDFGRSTRGSGTCRFKEQWGAGPFPLHWYYWTRGGESLPEMNPENPRYRKAIALWKRLPVAVTRWIGPAIVRNLP